VALKAAIGEAGLAGLVRANAAGCLDACEHGASMVVYPEAVWYGGVTVADVEEIVQSHLVEGRPVERLRIHWKVGSPTTTNNPDRDR
jgi:(2Fe-2S) ferredoxin